MEYMIAYFQLLKFLTTALLLGGAYYFYSTKRFKVGVWYLILLVLFWVFTPIKYDGTNSKEYHKQQEQKVYNKYANIDSTPIVTKKRGLDDIINEDNIRGQIEQIKINKEIK